MASGADRLSALYDELLHHVLSFLPAHEAVRTSVLVRRWRHLWRSAPALRVTGDKQCTNPAWFVDFVHNLLLLRDPIARLDSFELDRDFGFEAFLPANEAHVNTWLRHAATCGPRALLALRTTRGIYRHGVDDDPQRLPNVPLVSRHLTRLELETVICVQQHARFLGLSNANSSREWCPGIAGDLNILSCLLKHSPILEKLTLLLSEVPKVPVKTQRSYTPSEQPFAGSHLKIVVIKCAEDDGRVPKVMGILSTYNIPLENIKIQKYNIEHAT